MVAKFTSILLHDKNEATNTSLVRLITSELDTLLPTEAEDSTGMIEHSILAVKLHFYALLITRTDRKSVV